MNVGEWIDLGCHSSTRAETVRGLQVLVRRSSNTELQLSFRLDGDLPRIEVPLPVAQRFNKHLWQHTCFEAFIAVEGQAAYHEFNFAPSGEWAVYAFNGYRNGGPDENAAMTPRIEVHSNGGRLELDTSVRLDSLSAIHPRAFLRIGLAAIIEASDGLSYWALHHPSIKPDFHDQRGFVLLLEPPAIEC
jgi:hypothetical protein